LDFWKKDQFINFLFDFSGNLVAIYFHYAIYTPSSLERCLLPLLLKSLGSFGPGIGTKREEENGDDSKKLGEEEEDSSDYVSSCHQCRFLLRFFTSRFWLVCFYQ
jgi:hypothetical protein